MNCWQNRMWGKKNHSESGINQIQTRNVLFLGLSAASACRSEKVGVPNSALKYLQPSTALGHKRSQQLMSRPVLSRASRCLLEIYTGLKIITPEHYRAPITLNPTRTKPLTQKQGCTVNLTLCAQCDSHVAGSI